MPRRRRFLALVSLAVLGACGPAEVQDAGAPPTPPETTTSTTPVPATTTTSKLAVATTTTAKAAPATTNTTSAALLTGWSRCTNAERGYSIAHPPGWHTAHGCRYLDPEPLDIPPYTDGFFSALMTVDDDVPFNEMAQRSNDRFVVILTREQTTVGGRPAVRYEMESTGEGLLDKGSRVYSYVIDRSGRSFEVATAWFPGTSPAEYQLRKQIVDQAVQTIRFR